MIGQTKLKVCGITRTEDARLAAGLGADFLGVILFPGSPRFAGAADSEAVARLWAALPAGPRRVAVLVEPGEAELAAAAARGFDFFQIHARHDLPLQQVAAWSAAVGPARLWLAPKLPPGATFPETWLPLADTFLADTYHAGGYGGSGLTGDWAGFAALSARHPAKTWILAGGLGPDNIAEARTRSGAHTLDVNSGVETSPGIKDAEKLRRLAAALRL